MIQGLTVDAALLAFERAGCDVDAPEILRAWARQSFGEDDLPKVVRAKLADAIAGTKVWTARDQKPYPGSAQFVQRSAMVSGRTDDEAREIRIVCLARADGWPVDRIARAESIDPAAVVGILRRHGVDPSKPRPRRIAKVDVPVSPAAAEQAEKAEQTARLEAVRKLYSQLGRSMPDGVRTRLGKPA